MLKGRYLFPLPECLCFRLFQFSPQLPFLVLRSLLFRSCFLQRPLQLRHSACQFLSPLLLCNFPHLGHADFPVLEYPYISALETSAYAFSLVSRNCCSQSFLVCAMCWRRDWFSRCTCWVSASAACSLLRSRSILCWQASFFEWDMDDIIQLLMRVSWLALLLVLRSVWGVVINVNTVSLSSNYTLTSNVLYSFNMTFPSLSIPASSSILMQFSIHYTIDSTSLSGCKYSITGASFSNTSCTAAYNSQNNQYQVTFPSIYPSNATAQTSLYLQFNINNPQLAALEYINIFIISGSSIATGLTSITYTASPLNSCSYTSSNQTTGVNSTRTITFFPSAPVYAGSTFVMTLPPWFGTLSSNPISLSGGTLTCAALANSDSSAPGCNSNVYQDSTTGIYYEEIDVTGLIGSNKVLASAISFSATALRNPPSLAPFGPIIFELKIPDPNSGGALTTSQTCTGIYQTVTTMNTPTSISFTINGTLAISTPYTGKTARLSINNPFPYATGQLMVSFPSSMSMVYVPNTYPVVSTSTSLTFSNLQSSDVIGSGIISVPGITVTTPPSSRAFTITITSQTLQGGTVYGIDSNSITLSCLTGTLTAPSLAPTSTSVNAVTQYVLGFTTANALTTASFIAIAFPAQLTATVGSCTTNNTNVTCSVSNTSYASLSVTGALAAGSAVRVTFPSVKNPIQTQTTASFQVRTYYDAGLDSLVDRLTSGITMTSTPNAISSASVTPTSAVAYALTSYTFTVQLADPIPANGYIQIVFPPTVTFGTLAIASATFAKNNCSLSLNASTLSLNGCFASDMATLATTIVISGIYNPPSLQPTSSFSFSTYGPLGKVNYINSGLAVTMTTAATTTSFTIGPLSAVVHSSQQYNLGFSLAVPHQSGDYFTLSVPSSMAIAATPSCSGLSGISNVSCLLLNSTTIKVNLNAVPLSASQIAIFTIRNYDVATSVSFQAYFYDSGNYAMESTLAAAVTYLPAAIATFALNSNNQIALYENSNITITLSTPFALDSSFTPALASLSIVPPALFTTTANTSCSSPAGTCSLANNTFTVSAVGLSLAAQTVTISNIVLPYFSPSSSSFSIDYLYDGLQVATVSSGVAVTVYCTSPCERCTASQTACASCLPIANTALIYLFSGNSSCLSSCPDGFYVGSGNACQPCNSPCLWCSDSVNCTKCSNTTYLYSRACLAVCPATYFGNSSNICDSCVSPCANCTALTACLSCSANFWTNFTCVAAASCPAGTYGDVASKTCAACASPCANCFSEATNCTSCVAGFVYYLNSCPAVCPSTYYNASNACAACLAPCGNCSSATACLSCTSDYLSGSSCVAAASCPAGTYADNATNTCATCPTGCAGCLTATYCSSCTSVFFFYNFTCVVSCPNSTFLSGSSCVPCSSSCLTCSGASSTCTGCPSPSLLFGSSCTASCPNGTYASSSSCLSCLSSCLTCSSGSTCSSCSGSLFLSGSHCLASCSAGTFQDLTANNCSACDATCLTCSAAAANCTACPPALVLSGNSCLGSCPANYFNVSGSCRTCANCVSCTSVTSCTSCLPGYYIFGGACYSSCPVGAILDALTQSCSQCNASCASCSGSSSNCLSCAGSLFLLNGVCIGSCPSGYIASAGACTAATIGNIVYFPFSITFAVFLVIVLYSKSSHHQTETVTALCAFLAFLAWLSWLALALSAATADLSLEPSALAVILGVSVAGIVASALVGVGFAVWFKRSFREDGGFEAWAAHTTGNLYAFRTLFTLSLLAFPVFRALYCRLFNRGELSAFFVRGGQLLGGSGRGAVLHTVLSLFPMLFASGYVVYVKRQYDQTLIYAIDSLLLDILLAILLVIDTNSKEEGFFAGVAEDHPYLKRFAYDHLNHSLSSLRDFEGPARPRPRTDPTPRERDRFFREKISIIDDLNRFGHLDTPLPAPLAPRRAKTLPEDIQGLPQFDINEEEIQVVDEDFFLQEEERRRQREREEEEERLAREEAARRRREEEVAAEEERERERRRRLLEDDMDEQHSVEFPDLAAIEKVERKGESLKKSPTHILSNFKKVEDRPVGEKERRKVEELARKNGLDPAFLAETFGIEKHHNPQLLNSIIDKHNHVDREAVKALFSPDSSPELLQELFAKKSPLSPERLRQLMNDPHSADIIRNLASAEQGIVSADIARALLEGNSKYSEQFVKELLRCGQGEEEGVLGAEKVRQLLRDSPDKVAREASLKALKRLGGDSLQNKEVLRNLLGEQSLLDPESFNRVCAELSREATDQLFGSKSPRNDVLIAKLLNNKKIDLRNLSTILEDPQLLEELAKALSSGSKELEENLLNLFKNGEKLDPELLKDFLSRPTLLEKLASHPVDPVFLGRLLGREARTDLGLLEGALEGMSAEQVGAVFAFNPEKNVDFAKVAQLFERNPRTDPALLAQLLQPELVESIYNKASSAKPEILNKLVEKGKRIEPDSILRIYGDGGRGAREEGEGPKKYNATESNFNSFGLGKEEEDGLGFKRGSEVNMSRTDGRMLGFLSPIQVGLQRNRRKEGMEDIGDEELTEYNVGEGREGEGEEGEEWQVEGGKRRRRRKLKKKPLDDIRLPSEQIYLQRLQAPHELKKKNIRKKKKASSSMQQLQPMDEDNEVYDLDF